MDTFIETNNSYAFLCHVCDPQALKYFMYQDELTVCGTQLSSHISSERLTRLRSLLIQ